MADDTDRPARERATVVSLSRLAGVAASTVSRALKDDPRISEETRRRIQALAAESGYTPNILARTLSSGRSGLIGFVLGPIENPFYSELLLEAVGQAAARGLRLLMLHAGAGPVEERTAEALLNYQVDGCLITSAELSSRAASICRDHEVPVVMINRVPRDHASAVSCDNVQGARDLAALLLTGGHKLFAIVKGHPTTSTSLDRERGFADHLSASGIDVTLRLDGGSTYDGGFAAGRVIAEMPDAERPDAIFAVADIMAMAVIDALRIAGLRVPEDVSVVGFDGIAASARPAHALTTVVQPRAAMVARGLDLLIARMGSAGTLPDERVLLPGELVLRSSARMARG